MKKTILSLLVALMATTGAWADYGWYSGSMTIGGVTTDCTAWSTDSNNPTDLGFVTDMTVTSVAFNVWSDANDRGGANMFFRIWDGGSSQVGSDQDLWLGSSNRIAGDHDFAISWTGTLDLASAVGLTLEHGKTYYIDMYAKTYGNSGDEWYSGGGANFHAKLTCVGPTTSGITWNVASNSGTFSMPAYDVEVSTELWYILKQDGETPAANKSKTDVFLDRTLQAKVGGDDAWNTFCVPFPISAEKVTALGMTVKQLSGTSFSNGMLTLDFTDVTTGIAAGTPYLVRVASDLDFTADGNEFEGVSQDWATTHPVTPGTVGVDDWVTFVPVLTPTPINDNTKLYLGGARTLYYPSSSVNVKGFRAYFQLNNGLTAGTPAAGIRAFVLNIGDEETGIVDIEHSPLTIDHSDGAVYDLHGRRMERSMFRSALPLGSSKNGQRSMLKKGVYIVNGKKVVVK